MTTEAKAAFSMKRWDEKTWDGQPYDQVTGPKLTRAEVSYTYTGDIEGESTIQYLMFYRADGTGNSIGFERIEGKLGERAGSFLIQHDGTFAEKGVDGTFAVVPGSGTGDLIGLRGQGKLMLQEQPWYITLTCKQLPDKSGELYP